jgi:hypothetical protein
MFTKAAGVAYWTEGISGENSVCRGIGFCATESVLQIFGVNGIAKARNDIDRGFSLRE